MLKFLSTGKSGTAPANNFRTASAGTAKFRDCPPLKTKVATPMTSPLWFSTGEPLDPAEIGAVICNTDAPSFHSRKDDTIPSVSVPSKPKGLPMTATCCPTSALPESAKARNWLFIGRVIFSKARSFFQSSANKLSTGNRPPFSVFAIAHEEPSMTWWFVMSLPSLEIKKPVPVAISFPVPSYTTNSNTAGLAFLASTLRSIVSVCACTVMG